MLALLANVAATFAAREGEEIKEGEAMREAEAIGEGEAMGSPLSDANAAEDAGLEAGAFLKPCVLCKARRKGVNHCILMGHALQSEEHEQPGPAARKSCAQCRHVQCTCGGEQAGARAESCGGKQHQGARKSVGRPRWGGTGDCPPLPADLLSTPDCFCDAAGCGLGAAGAPDVLRTAPPKAARTHAAGRRHGVPRLIPPGPHAVPPHRAPVTRVAPSSQIEAEAAEMHQTLDELGSDLRGLSGQMEALEVSLVTRVVQFRNLILAVRAGESGARKSGVSVSGEGEGGSGRREGQGLGLGVEGEGEGGGGSGGRGGGGAKRKHAHIDLGCVGPEATNRLERDRKLTKFYEAGGGWGAGDQPLIGMQRKRARKQTTFYDPEKKGNSADLGTGKQGAHERLWIAEHVVSREEVDGITMWEVKWRKWASKFNTWEPTENLTQRTWDLIADFQRVQATDKGEDNWGTGAKLIGKFCDGHWHAFSKVLYMVSLYGHTLSKVLCMLPLWSRVPWRRHSPRVSGGGGGGGTHSQKCFVWCLCRVECLGVGLLLQSAPA